MSNNQKIKKSTWIGWFLEQKKDINRKASEISKTENWNSVNSSGLMLISCLKIKNKGCYELKPAIVVVIFLSLFFII